MVKRAEGVLLQSIVIDRSAPNTVSAQICNGLREMILTGALGPGERLPATRTMAAEFGVARTTIVDCFDRLLAEVEKSYMRELTDDETIRYALEGSIAEVDADIDAVLKAYGLGASPTILKSHEGNP